MSKIKVAIFADFDLTLTEEYQQIPLINHYLDNYKEFNPNFLRAKIDSFKNASMSVKDVQSEAKGFENEKIAEIYNLYLEKFQRRLL